jgi:hypothetical protein
MLQVLKAENHFSVEAYNYGDIFLCRYKKKTRKRRFLFLFFYCPQISAWKASEGYQRRVKQIVTAGYTP